MDIKAIIAKMLAGEALTDAEKKFLESYNPDDAGRIPKSRLDEEITKRKEAEGKLTEQQGQIDQLTTKVTELENKDLSEADKAKKTYEGKIAQLQAENKTLKSERDTASSKLADTEFKGKMRDLAGKHKFADADYLGHLMKSNNVNLDDAGAVSSYMSELEKSSPGLFKSSAKPGSSTQPTGGTPTQTTEQQRLAELLKKPELSNQEATEVIGLQEKINEAAQGQSGDGAGGKTGE